MNVKKLSYFVLLSVLAGCNEPGDTSFGVSWENDDVEILQYTQDMSSYYFLRQKRSDIQMEALINGKLIMDNGCTVLEFATGNVTVIWPDNYSLENVNNTYRVSGNGIIVEEQDSLRLSGGFYSQVPDDFCSGSFWMVGDEIEVLE
jgi:hypothetical protein